jgi:4-amino-4-deoxy-L-arabinose transferase-like glycosyltransferase
MHPPALSDQTPGSWDRFVWGSFILITLFGWLIKLPILHAPIFNPDSVIYLDLARGWLDGRGYTLQGSTLLKDLPASLYDHQIFNHPPVFTLMLMPLVYLGIPQAGVLVSWLGQSLCALAVALIGREVLSARQHESSAKVVFILALAGVTLDPILSFCSRRVWMDNLVAGFVALAFAGLLIFLSRRQQVGWLVCAGLAIAMAVGTKLIAILFLPILMLALLWGRNPLKEWKPALVLSVPAAVVFAVWEMVFFRATGVWFPNWLAIGEDLLKANPFVAHQVSASPIYLWESMIEVAPVTLLILPVALWEALRHRSRLTILLLGAGVLYVTLLTVLGMRGVSKEARYLSLAMPFWYMTFFGLRSMQGRHPLFLVSVGLAIVAGAMLSGFYFFALAYDEPLSAFALMEALKNSR